MAKQKTKYKPGHELFDLITNQYFKRNILNGSRIIRELSQKGIKCNQAAYTTILSQFLGDIQEKYDGSLKDFDKVPVAHKVEEDFETPAADQGYPDQKYQALLFSEDEVRVLTTKNGVHL